MVKNNNKQTKRLLKENPLSIGVIERKKEDNINAFSASLFGFVPAFGAELLKKIPDNLFWTSNKNIFLGLTIISLIFTIHFAYIHLYKNNKNHFGGFAMGSLGATIGFLVAYAENIEYTTCIYAIALTAYLVFGITNFMRYKEHDRILQSLKEADLNSRNHTVK